MITVPVTALATFAAPGLVVVLVASLRVDGRAVLVAVGALVAARHAAWHLGCRPGTGRPRMPRSYPAEDLFER